MPPPTKEQGERLVAIGKALRKSVQAPTDSFVTEDIPLLLTKLSRVKRD